jgi:hypothetical protein
MSSVLALLLSLLISQEAAPPVEPAPASAAASEADYPIPTGAPADDYGLVAWCYGALSSHMSMYDKVIGDVEGIEKEIGKIPGAPPADMKAYRDQRDAGRDTLKQFRRAMEAAEKASPKPIAPYGAASLKQGGQVWNSVASKDRKYIAREWMSWGLPGRCLPTAERLEARSALFGQALTYNAKAPEAPAETPAPATAEPAPNEPAPSGIDALLPGEALPPTAEEPTLRGPQ